MPEKRPRSDAFQSRLPGMERTTHWERGIEEEEGGSRSRDSGWPAAAMKRREDRVGGNEGEG